MALLDIVNINYCLILFSGLLFVNGKKCNRFLFFLIATQLALLMGLRGKTVGFDTHTYIDYFTWTQLGVEPTWIELGNRAILKAIIAVSDSPTVMFVVYAAITVFPVFWVIKNESENAHLSIIVYCGLQFYYFAYNGMRQGAAMSLALVAVYYLNLNKSWRFLIWVLVASLLHRSALVVLLCWVIKKTKIRVDISWLPYIAAISVLGALFGKSLVMLVLRFFSRYAGYIGTTFADEGNWLHPFMFLSILAFLLWITPINDERVAFDLTLLGVGVVLYFISTSFQLMNRVTYYFIMPLIVLLPNAIETMSRNNRTVSKIIAYVAISVYHLLLIIRKCQGIIPYRFFWQ